MYTSVKLRPADGRKAKPGPKPKPSTHPLGRLIRERREARGWSVKQLAEAVGIGKNSIALVTLMEFGKRPPRLDVARRLAEVLGLDEVVLIEWAQTRHRPMSPGEVTAARRELEARLRTAPARVEYAARPTQPITRQGPGQPDDIPVYEAGVDPDDAAATPVAFLRREGKLRHEPLVRPVAYRVGDADLQRLSKVKFPPGYAIISRPLIKRLDPREPYAVRLDGRVVLSYAGWDGNELLLPAAAGAPGFDLIPAKGIHGLRRAVVGQIVVGIEDRSWRRGFGRQGGAEAAGQERVTSPTPTPSPRKKPSKADS